MKRILLAVLLALPILFGLGTPASAANFALTPLVPLGEHVGPANVSSAKLVSNQQVRWVPNRQAETYAQLEGSLFDTSHAQVRLLAISAISLLIGVTAVSAGRATR